MPKAQITATTLLTTPGAEMPCKLTGIFCSTSNAGTLTIYDSATATATNVAIATFTMVSATNYQNINMPMNRGIYAVLAGTVASCTVIWDG